METSRDHFCTFQEEYSDNFQNIANFSDNLQVKLLQGIFHELRLGY